MLEIITDVDDVLLGIIVRTEHFQKRLLGLVKFSLLNTENKIEHISSWSDQY